VTLGPAAEATGPPATGGCSVRRRETIETLAGEVSRHKAAWGTSRTRTPPPSATGLSHLPSLLILARRTGRGSSTSTAPPRTGLPE